MKIQWLFRIGLVACAIALGVLNLALWQQQGEVPSGDLASDNNDEFEVVNLDALPEPEADEPQLVNDAWEITDMATAHGAFVIEVEADDPSRTDEIARSLVEPIKTDYDEILVYIHQRGDESDLPARRMQWTPSGGYVELEYPSEEDSAR
tara:strand:+ start:123 stop:572 length:450 start_codon:yes stop_codon:yes gene_type:complete